MSVVTPDATPSAQAVERWPSGQHCVRLMTFADLECVTTWHRQTFPSGFYAQLGTGFLRRWFAAHMAAPASVSLVACDSGGQVVGYLLGSLDDADYRDRRLGDSARTLVRGTSALLSRPGLWPEFARMRARPYAVRAVRRVQRQRGSTLAGAGAGELVYICVEPDHRRRGAGAMLLEAYTGEAIRSGTARLHLVTEIDNVAAQRFYARHGWHVLAATGHALDGRTLVRMQRHLGLGGACAG